MSCGIEYVGKSVINLNLKMNNYRRGKSGCEIAINHFKNVYPGSKFATQILEKLPDNSYRRLLNQNYLNCISIWSESKNKVYVHK